MNVTKNQFGFTILEVMMSIAIMAVIAGLGIPIFISFQTRNDLDITETIAAQSLRRVQILAQASDGDEDWGVYLQSGSITLFQGSSYLSRNTEFDEVFNIPTNITPSGLQEVTYSKFFGLPQNTGTIIITSNTNEIREIIINEAGTIQY